MADDPGYFRIHGYRANLGESHRCSHRKRTPEPGRKSDAKRAHNKLKLLSERLRSLCAQGGAAMVAYLVQHLRGHIQYFGVSGYSKGLGRYLYFASGLLFKWLNRCSQRCSLNWKRFAALIRPLLPRARIVHDPYPVPWWKTQAGGRMV